MMQEFDFASPDTLEEVFQMLADTGGRVIAGGTDVIPRLQRHNFPTSYLIDISHLGELSYISEENEKVHIAALTTYSEMLDSPVLHASAPSLIEAAWTIGCPQTRYRATLGGNIANASPAGDTLPPLLTLDASVRLLSAGGERTLPLFEVLVSPGQTSIDADEILHSVSFARLPEPMGMAFLKLGNRKGMNIAVASVAVALVLSPDGHIEDARVALGSVAPTPIRSASAEAALKGASASGETFQRAAEAAMEDIAPISDLRASDTYRRHAVEHLVGRAMALSAERGRVPT